MLIHAFPNFSLPVQQTKQFNDGVVSDVAGNAHYAYVCLEDEGKVVASLASKAYTDGGEWHEVTTITGRVEKLAAGSSFCLGSSVKDGSTVVLITHKSVETPQSVEWDMNKIRKYIADAPTGRVKEVVNMAASDTFAAMLCLLSVDEDEEDEDSEEEDQKMPPTTT